MRILQGEPTKLPAYPNYAVPGEIRAKACDIFEAGTYGCAILAVKEEQRFYGKSAEEIRDILDCDGSETGDFVLIDKEIEQSAVVTYVGEWHDPSSDGLLVAHVNKERILQKLRMKLHALPFCWTNYNIGNSSLVEDISMVLGGNPYDPYEEYSALHIDEDEDVSADEVVYVLAEPGEWEEGPGNLLDIDPPQDRVYRLKSHVAERNNLSNPWAVGWTPVLDLNAPNGSMCLPKSGFLGDLHSFA